MFDVEYNGGGGGHKFPEFSEKLIEICNFHKTENRALAFAIILYDFHNPNIRKVLHDEDYWRDLNKTSGKYLTVFSINYKEKPTTRRKKNPKDSIGYLTSVHISEDQETGNEQILNKYFELEGKISYPAILFFQVDDNKVSDSFILELNEEKIEDAFIEIKAFIKSAVDALKLISTQNRNNHSRIFAQLTESVRRTRFIRKRYIKKILTVFELIASFSGFFK